MIFFMTTSIGSIYRFADKGFNKALSLAYKDRGLLQEVTEIAENDADKNTAR